MDPLSIVLLAVNGIRTVLANPALGGGSSVRLDQASELLGILGALIERGDDALGELKDFTDTIEAMAAEGRGPTSAEWDALRGRSDDAHARLQEAKEELTAEEPDPDPEPEPDPTPEPEPEPEPEVVEEDPTEEEPEPPPTG